MQNTKAISLPLPSLLPQAVFFALLLLLVAHKPNHAANFTDDHGDGVLTDWTVEGSRTWSEAGGAALPQDGSASQGFLVHDNVESPNGTFEATLNCDTPSDNAGSTLCRYGGLLFRFTSTTQFYMLYLQESFTAGQAAGNAAYLLINTTNPDIAVGAQKILIATNLDFTALNRAYPLKITMSGPTLTFFLSNVQIGQVTDNSNLGGSVGYAYGATWTQYATFLSSQWTEAPSPPVIQALSPTDGAIHVPTGRQPLRVQFNKAVQKGTGNIVIQDATNTVLETIDVTSSQVAIDGDGALRHGFESSTEGWSWGAAVQTRDNTQFRTGAYSLKAVTTGNWQQAEGFYSYGDNLFGYDWSAMDSVIVWVRATQAGTSVKPYTRSGAMVWNEPTVCNLTQDTWVRCAHPLDLISDPSRVQSFGLNFSTAGTYFVDDVGLKKVGTQYATIVPNASMVADKTYSVQIDAGAFEDLAGNPYAGISDNTTWNLVINRTPTDIALTATSIAENQASGSTVATLSATDPDGAEPFVYSLVAGTGSTDNASFSISGSNLNTAAIFDYETKASYAIRLRVNDGYGRTYDEQFTITVDNVNDNTPALADASPSIAENSANATPIVDLNATDADGALNALSYSITAGNDDGKFTIDASTGVITVAGNLDFETTNSYALTVQVSDGTFTDNATVTIGITDANDAPTDITLANASVDENAAANTVVGALSTTDVDAGDSHTYTFIAGAGDTDNASFNINGADLRATAALNFETKSSYTVRVRTTDAAGLTFDEAFTITVNNVNETPTDITLANTTVDENAVANTIVGALSTTDVDAGDSHTYTFIAGAGDTDNASFNISGADLRATAALDFETKNSYSVRVRTTDAAGLTYDEAFSITVNDGNDAPSITSAATANVPENTTAVLSVTSTDEDAGATATYSLVAGNDAAFFSIHATTGALTFLNAPNFEQAHDNNANNVYEVTVQVSDGSLTATQAMSITVTNSNDAPVAGAGGAVQMTGSGGYLSAADNATLEMAQITLEAWIKLTANAGNTQTIITKRNSTTNADYIFQVSGSSGKLIFSSTGGMNPTSFTGNTSVLDDQWHHVAVTYNNAFIRFYIDGVEDAAMAATGGLDYTVGNLFVGALNGSPTAVCKGFLDEVRIWSVARSAAEIQNNMGIPLIGNEANLRAYYRMDEVAGYALMQDYSPNKNNLSFHGTLNSTSSRVASGAWTSPRTAEETAVTFYAAWDEDGDAITLSTTTPPAHGLEFYDNTAKTSSYTPAADYAGMDSYTFQASDGSLATTATANVNVLNTNDAPTDIALANATVDENAAANTVVGALSSTDVDAGDSHTYTFIAGAGDTDNASFNINGTDLRATASLNFETKSSHTVRVRTTDAAGLTYDEAFTITVNDVNEAPTDIVLANASVDENAAANTVIGALSSTDVDAGDSHTYTFIAGAGDTDNATFNISGADLRATASLNFETKSSYTVRVRTTDAAGLTYDEAFTITVNNVNETPTDIILANTSVDENAAANTVVGALSSTDVDAGDSHTYTFIAGAGDTDNASFNINGTDLRATASLNFETKSSYTVRVRTTDAAGLTYDEAFTITVNDVNEAPTDIALANASVDENAAANMVVGALSSTDVDAGDSHTYTFIAGAGDTDNASFNINGTDLRATASLNFETKSSYTVRVRTTDAAGLTYDEAFTITVNNVNEAPTDIALANASVDENAAANTVVGALSSTDVDAGDSHTYTFIAGAGDTDNASFNINGTDLRASSSLNFEAKSSYTVRVRTTDAAGLTYDEAFTITVNNVNEAPTITSAPTASLNENLLSVLTISSNDPDAGSTATYSIAGGNDQTLFHIDPVSGALTFATAPDFEMPADANGDNVYAVTVQVSDGLLLASQAMLVTVNNVVGVDIVSQGGVSGASFTVNENTTAITTVQAIDEGEAVVSYAITGGADQARFSIVSLSGALSLTQSANFESPLDGNGDNVYEVEVTATGDQGATDTQTQYITIVNVQEAPSALTLDNNTLVENAGTHAVVGQLSSTDEDAGDSHSYTLVSGSGDTDNAAFNILGNSLRATSSLDFELQSSYTVRVRSTDVSGLFVEQAFSLTVSNVQEYIPPSWNGQALVVYMLDTLRQHVLQQSWLPGDTLLLNEGTAMRFTLNFSTTSTSVWSAQVLSAQTQLTVSEIGNGVQANWNTSDTGLQVLALGWGQAGLLDSIRIPCYVRGNLAPTLTWAGMRSYHAAQQTFVNYTENGGRLTQMPSRLDFRMVLHDNDGDQLSWRVLQNASDISTQQFADTLLVSWSTPQLDDEALDIVVTDPLGASDTLHIAWTYALATATRNGDHATFALRQDGYGKVVGVYLPKAARIRLSAYDAQGSVLYVRDLQLSAGEHPLELPAGSAQPKWVRLQCGNTVHTLQP